ncbi:MAG: hypothetical protein ACYCOU_23200 [Sulfobacillus sp.]
MGTSRQALRLQVVQLRGQKWTAGRIFAFFKKQKRAGGAALPKRTIERWCVLIDADQNKFMGISDDSDKKPKLKNDEKVRAIRGRKRRNGLPALKPKDRTRAVAYLESHGSLRKSAKNMHHTNGVVLSRSTLQRERVRQGATKHHPSRKPKLPKWLMKERVQCALELENYP